MEQEDITYFEILEKKIDHLQKTVDQVRRYFLITTVITIVMVILPIILMIFIIPHVINTYSGLYEGLL